MDRLLDALRSVELLTDLILTDVFDENLLRDLVKKTNELARKLTNKSITENTDESYWPKSIWRCSADKNLWRQPYGAQKAIAFL